MPEVDFLKRNTNGVNEPLPSSIVIFAESGCHGCVLSLQNWFIANGIPEEMVVLIPDIYGFENFYDELPIKNQVFKYKLGDFKTNALQYYKGALIVNNNNQLETIDIVPDNLEFIINTLEKAKSVL